jgi:hypothetical protein
MNFKETKEKLDSVGCGFCLAKWTQVTMHLHNGLTHSCHHPVPHKVPLEELKENPKALHNTLYKKLKRKEMLEGKRPSECNYCWNVEDSSNSFSDRVFKSSEPWSEPHLEDIKNSKWDDDFNPKYVEVSFSNTCNFKCSYCGPMFSSKWIEEIERHGAYPTSGKFNDLQWIKDTDQLPYRQTEYNPYVEAFWKWWPELYNDLDTFRITGGEPLLSKDTWKILDYIINEKNPNKELHLAINTNLGVPDDLIERLVQKINIIEDQQRVKDFVIFTSLDGWGSQAEYGRHGLVFNKFWDNIQYILSKCPTVTVGIMSTYNALSVTSYDRLIEEVAILKQTFTSSIRSWTTPVSLDVSYLRYPTHQTVQILPEYFYKLVKQQGELAKNYIIPIYQDKDSDNILGYSFNEMEVAKIQRIYDWMIIPQEAEILNKNRKDFYKFFSEHDRRRGTDFCKTFPELEEFYNRCKEIKI